MTIDISYIIVSLYLLFHPYLVRGRAYIFLGSVDGAQGSFVLTKDTISSACCPFWALKTILTPFSRFDSLYLCGDLLHHSLECIRRHLYFQFPMEYCCMSTARPKSCYDIIYQSDLENVKIYQTQECPERTCCCANSKATIRTACRKPYWQ